MKRYATNQAFRIKKDGKAYFLRHQNGARIRTDRLVNAIWEKADGRTFPEIKRELELRLTVSDWMLNAALSLMEAADLLTISGASDNISGASPSGPTEEEGLASVKRSALADTDLSGPAEEGLAQVQSSALFESDGGRTPLVSIIIVNRDGEEHLSTLLPSLARQDYPNIEIVMVDNGSKDKSVALLKDFFPDAKVVMQKKDDGFSGGNNAGIEVAAGEYMFLLNNDTELADDCIGQLVAAAEGKTDMAAIVPKMYLWRLPRFLNAIGNSIWPRGWGSDNYIGYLDIGQFDETEQVFGACFGAVMISREALDTIGLLDPKYKFYYEDADWSYRARLMGRKIYFAPGASVYHKFNASMKSLEPNFKWQLVIGNRLRFITKNLSKGTLLNFMRNYAKEDVRGFLRSVKHGDMGMAGVYMRAWSRFLSGLPGIMVERRKIQKNRVLKDGALFELWPELPPLLDLTGNPIFDMATIRRIYVHFLENEGGRMKAEDPVPGEPMPDIRSMPTDTGDMVQDA